MLPILLNHSLAYVPMLGLGIVLIGILRVLLTLILGVIAMGRRPPQGRLVLPIR
jgi:hypothetical protein